MNHGKMAVKNSTAGLLAQFFSVFLQFITRSLLIKFLGIEWLGLSGTFASLLGALSVAELGFQTAVLYNLYKPIAENNTNEINKIINIYKVVYRTIGIFFVVASCCCLLLLPYVITGVEINNYVRLIFLLQAMSSSCTYFLAYKRTLLYADQCGYLSCIIDMFINLIVNIVQIFLIIVLKSFVTYLVLKLIQTFLSNILVHAICTRKYPYLHKDRIDIGLLKRILKQVQDVFLGKIAGYIYSSTDSLVISSFVSTAYVGYFNNYTMITNNIKVLANSITTPIAPIIGNLIASAQEESSQIAIFETYNYLRFLLAGIVVAPVIVLTDSFIGMWIGTEYLLPASVLLLLAADLYIHILHTSCCDYISGNGLFKLDKYISMIGAVTNITLSIIFVKSIGIPGVLAGTVFSQMIFWITRSFVTYRYCFRTSWKEYMKYWIKQIFYFVTFTVICSAQTFMYAILAVDNVILRFMIGGVLCEVIFLFGALIFCIWMPEEKRILLFVWNKCK